MSMDAHTMMSTESNKPNSFSDPFFINQNGRLALYMVRCSAANVFWTDPTTIYT
jgi:hypothetical protein